MLKHHVLIQVIDARLNHKGHHCHTTALMIELMHFMAHLAEHNTINRKCQQPANLSRPGPTEYQPPRLHRQRQEQEEGQANAEPHLT
jgi:hypothetical protein